jgi:hypothetical protein
MTGERYKYDAVIDAGREMRVFKRLFASLIALGLAAISACSALPGGTVVDSATIVYTVGSRQHTAAVEVPLVAQDVYAALVRGATANAEVEIIDRNDKAMMIEVSKDTRQLTGQVTKFGENRSLLYVWADAGTSGQTGQELALEVVEKICDDLSVAYELVSY